MSREERLPFGPGFFRETFAELARARCAGPSPAGVTLHLAGSEPLDVCHIVKVAPDWIAVAVFADRRECEEMSIAFVPYATILRVEIVAAPTGSGRLGFQWAASQAALEGSAGAPSGSDG